MVQNRVQGFWKLHKRIKNLKGIVGKSIDDSLEKAAKRSYREIVANASRKDKKPHELESLGNPFAARHETIQGSRIGGEWTEKPWMIHADIGNVVRSIRYQRKGHSVVFHYRYQASYVKYVVKGTRVLLARNVIVETLNRNERKISDRFRKDFKTSWNRRSKITKDVL